MSIKPIFLSFLLVAVSAHADVAGLVPRLASSELAVQTQARLDLLALCSQAGRPGAEEERMAVCVEICALLKGDQPVETVIQPLIRNLERIGGDESVSTLAGLLDHADPHVADAARRALVANRSPFAGEALMARLKMCKDRSPNEMVGLITGLGERMEKGASSLIADHIDDPDDLVSSAAIKALGCLGEDDGVRALMKYRSTAAGFRLVQVNDALFALGRTEVFKRLNAPSEPGDVRAIALLGLVLDGQQEAALEGLASGDPLLQSAVIEGVSQCRSPELQDMVAASLKSLPAYLQVQALGVLEHSGIHAYAASIAKLLSTTQDEAVQVAAVQALARIGTKESVSPLVALGSPEAKRALGMLDAEKVDSQLEQLAKEGGDAERVMAIGALAGRGRSDLLPVLFSYVAEDGTVAKASVGAIGELGDLSNLDQLARLMIGKEQSPLSRDLLLAIVAIMRRSTDAGKAVGILVEHMEGASPRSRANILQALVQTGSTEALKPVVEACKSVDEDLQKQAIKLLAGWQEDNAMPAMIELASNESLSLANHVVLMRGVSRILAGQNKVDAELSERALAACRRDEERKMIQEAVADKKRQ